ncbi:MAG: hypothetical protein L3K26_20605, partial [Candidatus Hydrogenedentes bacterium]|nr:hypothetical protein [Candidatus Hydrogenedentota bacterium]
MARFVAPALSMLFWALLALNIVSSGIQSMCYDGRFTPDSIFYADAAQNIASGRGITNSMRTLHERGIALPRPLTMWGPLYPLAIAAVTLSGLSAPAAALLLAAVFGGILLVGCYVLCRQLYDADVAMVGVAFLLYFQPFLLVIKHAWSETMGLSLAVLGFVVLVQARRTDRRSIALGLIFGGGLLLGLSSITRYALIPLLPVATTLLLPRWDGNTLTLGGLFTQAVIRVLVAKGLLLGAGAGIFVVPVVARSIYYTGQMGTVGGRVFDIDLVETLLRFLHAIRESLRLPGGLGSVALLVLLCGVLVHAKSYWKSGGRAWCHTIFLDRSRYLLWICGGGYILFLLYTQTRVRVDAIGARLLFPGTLFLFLYLVATLAHLSRWPAVLRMSIAIVLLSVIAYVQTPMALMVLHAKTTAPHDYRAHGARIESVQKLAEISSDKDLILAEDAINLTLYLGPRDVIFFRPAFVAREQLSFEKVSEILRAEGT